MLFDAEPELQNLLPFDGTVYYWGRIFDEQSACQYYERLLNEANWKNDEAIMYGKHIVTARRYAWYADQPYEYRYSGVVRQAQPWSPFIDSLRQTVQQQTGKIYNSALLNLYPDGNSGMAWHSDDEKDLVPEGSIASLSFGASRKFSLKHIATKEKREFVLHSGDLIEMGGTTQQYWMHSVPKTKKVTEPRINLTFRQMVK